MASITGTPHSVELNQTNSFDPKYLEAGQEASSSSAGPAGPAGPATGQMCLTIQGRKKGFYLHLLPIGLQDTEEEAIKKLNIKWHAEMSKSRLWHHAGSWLWRPVVDVGTLATIRPGDLESNSGPFEVIVSSREPSTELTAAFDRPSLLHGAHSFPQRYPHVMRGSEPQKTIVIGQELRKHVVFQLVSSAVLASILIGTIVGVVTKSVENGIGCSAVIAGIISVILVVMVWMWK